MLLAALSLLLALSPQPVERARHAVFDAYQRLLPLARTSQPVTIVAIDEPSLATFGQWPWPRTRIAELVRRISEGKPLAIGIDIFFPEPDRYSPTTVAGSFPGAPAEVARWFEAQPSSDQILADAIRGREVVLGIAAQPEAQSRYPVPPPAAPIRFVGGDGSRIAAFPGHIGNLEVIDRAAAGRGLMNSGPVSEIVRRSPLVARIGEGFYGSLAIESLRVGIGGGLSVADRGMDLIDVGFGEVSTRAQADGTAWIRFGRHTSDRFVSAHDVLLGRVAPETFKDKVALVGITGLGLLDHKTTPLGELVPGVEVHAQIVENLVAGVSLARPSIAPRVEAVVLIACGFLLVAFLPRTRAVRGAAVLAGVVSLMLAAGVALFLFYGLLFDPVLPAIGASILFAAMLVGTLAESEHQRRLLRDQAARMAGELDAARRIQMGLLPDPGEEFATERRFRVAALLEPARTVGGDFYDCFRLDGRRIFLVVADVSGKGLPAALFMASVKSHLKSAALRGGEVGVMLSRAQEEIGRENPELLFVTAFAAVLDPATGELEFANAGHEPPFVRKLRGAPERLSHAGGPPLCVMDGYVYPTWRRQLAPGEWLCVVTDGATEAMNVRKEFFGSERLKIALGWMPESAAPDELIRKLRDDVHRFAEGAEPADDLTLLALRWEGT